jgi:hypothetical protein
MNPTARTAVKWGLLIGLANMAWLYLAYFLGLHTNGIAIFQAFMLGWLALTITGFTLALREVKKLAPGMRYGAGLRAGALAAVVSAAVAVVAQIGYFKVVHPAWPDVMVGQARAHFESRGFSPQQVEDEVAKARRSFTLRSYATASAVTAVVTGVAASAVILLFLRRRPAPVT